MKRGFQPCGQCPDPRYPSGTLFQKSVLDIAEPDSPLFVEFELSASPFGLVPKAASDPSSPLLVSRPPALGSPRSRDVHALDFSCALISDQKFPTRAQLSIDEFVERDSPVRNIGLG
jgi:hypothetical protein